ncbi:MAG TPA: RES domain-containing protein [Gemmatimonadales bacterium]|jgi:RES domain-containing protein
MVAWRTCKTRHDPWDGTGAALEGGRWNSPGRPVLYAADTFAGTLVEILAHSARPRTLPGAHHSIRLDLPDELLEELQPGSLSGWHLPYSMAARAFGDQWLVEARTPVLVVPSVPARPVGRSVLINPMHAEAPRIARSAPFVVRWDDRLFV